MAKAKTKRAALPLRFHPLADIFPLMEGEEFDALVADIKANGLREHIVLYEGKVLEGRNRYRACLAAGVRVTAYEFEAVVKVQGVKNDPLAYVISANIHRRHLTADKKREIIAKLVAAQPEKSDRELAKQAKVSHPTIAKARREAEATGKALPVEKRIGKDGKARKQPKKRKPANPRLLVNDGTGRLRPATAEETNTKFAVINAMTNPIINAWDRADEAERVDFVQVMRPDLLQRMEGA